MEESEQDIEPHTKQVCWLCEHATMPIAEAITGRIVASISNVPAASLARQASQCILKEHPDAVGANNLQVLRHIKHHNMHPGVRLTEYLRDMHTITERLKTQMNAVDEESGHATVDLNTAKTYLATLKQITEIYRIGDITKLTFGSK